MWHREALIGEIGALYGSHFGHACVATYAPNAKCIENHNCVQTQLVAAVVPEPSSYALMA